MRFHERPDERSQHRASPPTPQRRPTHHGAPDLATPGSTAPAPAALVALQRTVGNAAVVRLLAGRQEEHEHAPGCDHQPPIQRSSVDDVLRSPGSPLNPIKREEMEARLGADFSDVRVHTDAVAQRSAVELGARAWTSGNDVVIGPGGADDHTLAHELTHVLQQRSGPVDGTVGPDGVRVSDPDDRFERAAEANATRAMAEPLSLVQRSAWRAPADGRTTPAADLHVQRTRYTTGPTEHDPDSDNYDSDADNFDTRYESQLPQPTDESTVASLVSEESDELVVLWRGTTLPKAVAMETAGSAGGVTPDPDTPAPDRASVQQQAQGGAHLPEFTTYVGTAEGFSHKAALVVVAIAARYLSEGARGRENGWSALPSAPLKVLVLVDRTRGQQQGHVANAS